MSSAIPLLVATTAGATAFPTGGYNATEADQIVICVNTNALGASETVTVFVLDSKGAQQALIDPSTGLQYQLGSAQGAKVLPGGFLYSFTKTATVAAVGVDVQVKPRIGNY